jgi:hypothetical protein
MSAKQVSAKQFLVEKGERVGLGVSALVAVALIVYGLFWPERGFFAGNPLEKASAIEKATALVRNGMQNAKPGDADKPPANAKDRLIALDTSLVNPKNYDIPAFFYPSSIEGTKRRPPYVLLPEEALAEAIWVPLDVYYMTRPEDEGAEGPKIYLLKQIKDSKTGTTTAKVPARSGADLLRGFGQFGAGMGIGSAGAKTGRLPGSLGSLGKVQTLDPLKPVYTLEQVALKDLGSLDNIHPARELRPLRMAIITASFPYKREIEIFREATRLKSASDVLNEKVSITDPSDPSKQRSLPGFRFLGVDLERCEVDSSGKQITDWVPIDVGEAYKPWMFRAGKRFEPDSAKLAAVSPRGLVMPRLLQFRTKGKDSGKTSDKEKDKEKDKDEVDLQNHYPNLEERLPKLAQTLEDLKPKLKEDTAPTMPSAFVTNDVDPFDASGDNESKKVGATPTTRPDGTTDSARGGTGNTIIPEYCLLRVIDVTIEPGKIYQYRIKVRMGNPNEGRNDVADPSWAKDSELPSSKWFDVPQRVTVPPELIYYAVDQKELPADQEYDGTYKDERVDPTRQTVLQLHRWLDYTRVGSMNDKSVAIGEWAIAERVIVNRGEYVDKTEAVQMPVWNPSHDSFVLPADKHGRENKKSTIRVDFSHQLKDSQETILVDFDGGPQIWRTPDPEADDKDTKLPKRIDDIGGVEVLLLAPDGKLIGRNSAADAQDSTRLERRKQVRERVKIIEKAQSGDKTTKPSTGPFSTGK